VRRRLALAVALTALAWTATPAQVVINEIHYNPAGDDAAVKLEFLELYNAGPTEVDLSAWQLDFGTDPLVFPIGTTLPSGAYLVAAEKISTLAAATGYTAQFEWQGLNAGLSNGNDDIVLLDASFALVDSVSYDDDPPWPTGPDGNGPSLELVNPVLDNTLGASWRASVGTNGTPGAVNSVFSVAPTIQSEAPRRLSAVAAMPSISLTFSVAVTGVAAGDLTVNGSPATSVSGSGAGPYVFSGFAAPAPGSASIAVASGSIEADGIPFPGESWTVSVGIVVVIHEIHYHPATGADDAEFLELYNAGTNAADLSGWTISDGLDLTFPPVTTLLPGAYAVVALDPAVLEAATGYAGALAWTSGRLANEGERLALSDAQGNEIDVVVYDDAGSWPTAADGAGPSLELVHSGFPNEYGPAWKPSPAANGTPGAPNGTFDPDPAPIIFGTLHSPAVPSPTQALTVTATILDESVAPTATIYYRRDDVPTVAYSSTAMLDDGLHGDGAAGDRVYGAIVPALFDSQRLDFTIRATDGVETSAAPAGNDTLAEGEFPSQTYLCEFRTDPPPTDLPNYRMLTTKHVRDLQGAVHDQTEYDATFLQCGPGGCRIFYNVRERYRGDGSLFQHPHSFRINFQEDAPIPSEMGFDITKLNLMSQGIDKQRLGYTFFREAFARSIPTPSTQFVRFHTNPVSEGGNADLIYINVEAVDQDFLESQDGQVVPERFPDRCSVAGTTCDVDADCPGGETCVATSAGDLYRGRETGDLQYLGTDPESYRVSYDKETNVEADDWTKLIDQCFALDADTTPDASFEASVEATANEEEWLRWFAIHMLLVNEEGGIYRDTGDDYYIYFEPTGSPDGLNSAFIPWDMDAIYGGTGGAFHQDPIWRTNVPNVQRVLRSNAFAGRFVGAICSLLETDFTQPIQDARIDALPDVVADATRKQNFKNFVAARIAHVNGQITRDLTIEGVPASPYVSTDPAIEVSGTLDQCGTYEILVNGAPATYSVFEATWSATVTLVPGMNTILVQDMDHDGVELHRREATVNYRPPVTVSFQNDGVYGGTQDSWIGEDFPNAVNGSRDHFRWDTDAPAREYGLLRFDGMFGSGPGQIPVGSNVLSASLTISFFNVTSGAPGELHESATVWSETTTWNLFGDDPGADPDEIGAFVAPLPFSGVASIDVTSSLAAWSASPSSNLGWIFVAFSTDEARVHSSEATVVTSRPMLTVTYLPPCTESSHCDDTLYCNGAETCSAGSCEAAILSPCDDGVTCTVDTCDEDAETCANPGSDALCDDGIACNGAETCGVAGCVPGTPAPPPAEVAGLAPSGDEPTALSWSADPTATRYDLATGSLASLGADQGVTAATCLEDDLATTGALDERPAPGPGSGYYYLVRAQNECATGTYGFATGGQERLPAAACP
jgi:hypothetical protein